MTEQGQPTSFPPEDSSSEDEVSRTQPGRRLRKLIAGSQENEAAMSPLPAADSLPEPDQGTAAEQGSEPEQAAAAADNETRPEQVAPASPFPPALPEQLEQPEQLVSTPPLEQTGPVAPPVQPPAAFPPAPASPDSTGGTIPARLSETQRHPTGSPESTAGWYSLSGPAQPPPPDQAQTRPFVPDQTRANPRGRRASLPQEPSQPPPPYAPPPLAGDTPLPRPLPRRVEEVDPNATRVTPAAYQSNNPHLNQTRPARGYPAQGGYPPSGRPVQRPPAGGYPPAGGTPPPYARSVGVPARGVPAARPIPTGRRKTGWRRSLGCALRLSIALLFIVVFVIVAAGSWLVFQYFAIARSLPPVDQLRARAAQFETTRIFDRNGDVLYEIIDPNAGRRTFVPISKISPNLIAATLATEDKEYYTHPGFDPVAIARAFVQNYTNSTIVSGASTITQQLARGLLLSPEERNQRTYERKAREIVLAAEITRKYSKDEILELYLNENFYGHFAYGIEAAAETYFGVTADKLTLGQAAFLAGLPQSPSVYDIETNRGDTLRRQQQVILLMLEDSQQSNCIEVQPGDRRVCVNEPEALAAIKEIEAYNFQLNQGTLRYPHWVSYIREQLEAMYDPQTIYRSGFNVYTTLDPNLQDQAQAMITQQVDSLADRNAHNGALVAIRPATGEILAMVGSPNFNDDEHAGQVNMAISPRQPGSSIKPLTYTAAFEKGWTPATLIWDVPTDFPPSGDPNDPRPPYQPVNYDGRFHGPVTVRTALSNSYNIPAVKTLQFIGIYGSGGLVSMAERLGIHTLTRKDYGLSLTLGGGEVTLLDMTSAFGVFADGGRRMPPVAITRITDYKGDVVFQYAPPAPQQVIRPEHAFLISSILSDNAARTPMFGTDSVLNLPFQAAAKTGTTNDFRDNWTLGYTPDLVTGVWIGNADFTPMVDVTGLTGAAPAWSSFMQHAVPELTGGSPTPFQKPDSVVEKVICAISGAEPSDYCNQQRSEFFAADQPPRAKEDDLWKKVRVDTWTGLRASSECSDFTDERFTLNVEDPFAVTWIKDTEQGRSWAASVGFEWPITFVPQRECRLTDPRPQIIFAGLSDDQTVATSPLDIYAVVNATANFKSFRLEWGPGDDPQEWKPLVENVTNQYKNPERIYTWDLMKDVPAGKITLRIWMESTDADQHAERRIRLNLNVPTPTPTPTASPTITPTVTLTPTPTQTPQPSLTPQPTHTPTPSETTSSP